MQVLVIGGSRFIGRAIVQRLLQDGHRVTLLNRGVTPDPFGTRVSRVLGDRTDPGTLERAVQRRSYDCVVDVVAFRGEDTAAAVTTLKGRIGHFIHLSTASVYLVRDRLYCPFREADFNGPMAPRPVPESSDWPLAYQKRRCEMLLAQAWARDRFPCSSLRLPMVVGPHDYTGRFRSYVDRLLDNGPIVLPDGGLNAWGFLWVGDVAEVVASNLLKSSAFGRAYNLCQREAVSLRQLVEAAATVLGKRPSLVSVPSQWLARVSLGTAFSPFTHDRDIVLDIAAARQDLMFTPTPFVTWCEQLVRETMSSDDRAGARLYQTRAAELQLVQELARHRVPVTAAAKAPAFR